MEHCGKIKCWESNALTQSMTHESISGLDIRSVNLKIHRQKPPKLKYKEGEKVSSNREQFPETGFSTAAIPEVRIEYPK